jgi:hypothetical protein
MAITQSPLPQNNPLPQSQPTISFYEASKAIIAGKKVHKLEWVDKGYYGFMNDNILSLHKPDGKNYQWIVSMGDLNGTDYIVL